ncbi:MAG: methylated-DNA--[protein]-cysteine S-methyltransferase [Eubacterium sp.]|nr:methylated-DNA--[protein]-cysteine S-methyltransferase [Eubacterium sp.]
MESNNILYLPSPVGTLRLEADQHGICLLAFCHTDVEYPESPASPLLTEAKRQLDEYFAGKREIFSLPLSFQGTAFQIRVWEALQRIPYGETWYYGQLAEAVGNPRACRAVGMANHRNPLPILIPCHRVIGKNGSLTGYGGGLHIKEKLLALEQRMRKENGEKNDE